MNLKFIQLFKNIFNRIMGIRRAKTPTMLQMEAAECGAASLGIVLAYHKKFVSLEKLRIDCGVTNNGSKASNIAKAARNYGLEVKAYKKEPEQLHDLPFPMIVFWDFCHFLVVEGFGKNKVYLNDPASGPRVVDTKTFDDSFTGVVLSFKPGQTFMPGGEKPKFVPILVKWLKGYGSSLLFLFLIGLAIIIPGLAIPVFSKIFIDEVLINQSESWIVPLLSGIALTTLLHALLSWLQQYSLIRFEMSLSLKNSSKFLWHVLHLPMSFHTQRSAGDISMRININDQVATVLSGPLGNTLLNLFTIVFYAAMMFYYSVPLALIAIAISLLNLFALRNISRKRIDSNQKLLQDTNQLFGFSSSGLQMIESLKAIASESDFFSQWAGYQSKLLNIQQKADKLTQTLQVIPIFLTSLSTLVVLWIGSKYIIDGVITVGTFVAFQSLMARFSTPITSLVYFGSALQDIEGGLKQIEDVYNYPLPAKDVGTKETEKNVKTTKLQGQVELKNISFGYSILEPPLINEFSLSLKPGNRVALVGRSGCGKTTVANLVSGLYSPWEGDVLFDEKPRQTISNPTLNNSIAMVDQNLFLFEGTAKENITFWDETISDKDIIQVAKDACIHDEIASRPGAYESIVAENGKNFSGGQRQRLEIARALATKPSILILDEATSALDAKTEQMIDANIRKKGCTCLIVAHRLSTIRDCDEIIVMDKGRIAQRGTHDELMQEKGLYQQLIKE